MAATKKKVPYRNGDMLSYATEYDSNVEWRDNIPFWATIVFDSISTGRSAVRGAGS